MRRGGGQRRGQDGARAVFREFATNLAGKLGGKTRPGAGASVRPSGPQEKRP